MSAPLRPPRDPAGPGLEIRRNERLVVHRSAVQPEWIDYNGHMNVAYYLLAFDLALDALFDRIGLTQPYRETHGVSTFALEVHLSYIREVRLEDPLRFEVQMLDLDEKRFHLLIYMVDDRTGDLCAAAEWISAHMDMTSRRMAPFRDDLRVPLERIRDAHRDMPWPDHAGRKIGIRRRKAS
ncbi:MAG: thioesterase family protein [Rhodospirillaceae bacterium]|nr:thioesterase family protein [Rhodospirillaceae bacterium]MDE0619567.1 thioesterase family protein [Rhodospirillaceae bacterium]